LPESVYRATAKVIALLDPTAELPDDTLISRVDFQTRIQNVLSGAGLRTVGDVREASDEMLLSLPVLGQGSVTICARP
jgi:DNA-directed RNA polymerase alpha subunit